MNATVPIAAEVLKKLGVFNPRKLFGVTTLDSVRAETFLGELIDEKPSTLKGKISVIGGHSGDTIVPLVNFTPEIANKVSKLPGSKYKDFIHRVQFGGDEVVKAKNGAGSATLSMAYAGYRFAEGVLGSFNTAQSTILPDSSYVYLPGIPGGSEFSSKYLNGAQFFSVPVHLKNGELSSFINPIEKLNVSNEESKLIKVALGGLESSIAQGTNFVKGSRL